VRSRRGPGIGAIVVLAVAVALLLLRPGGEERPGPGGPAAEPGGRAEARVLRVIDGDTIEVSIDGAVEDVRYIGVDTPESVDPDAPVECFGREAAALNERLVAGRTVALRFDAERRDAYGRLLAYVYAGPRLVNAELVRRGYARTLTIAPNDSRARLFVRLERRAARLGRGLWATC
jgi:micrococcal nuclease